MCFYFFFFFSSRRRHTRSLRDWSSDVCSSDLAEPRHRLEAGSIERSFVPRPRRIFPFSFGRKSVLIAILACGDRKSTRLNSSHVEISYAVFCLKKKKKTKERKTL